MWGKLRFNTNVLSVNMFFIVSYVMRFTLGRTEVTQKQKDENNEYIHWVVCNKVEGSENTSVERLFLIKTTLGSSFVEKQAGCISQVWLLVPPLKQSSKHKGSGNLLYDLWSSFHECMNVEVGWLTRPWVVKVSPPAPASYRLYFSVSTHPNQVIAC